jgi:hypothetical protein
MGRPYESIPRERLGYVLREAAPVSAQPAVISSTVPLRISNLLHLSGGGELLQTLMNGPNNSAQGIDFL